MDGIGQPSDMAVTVFFFGLTVSAAAPTNRKTNGIL
jgi:hypothetical protein